MGIDIFPNHFPDKMGDSLQSLHKKVSVSPMNLPTLSFILKNLKSLSILIWLFSPVLIWHFHIQVFCGNCSQPDFLSKEIKYIFIYKYFMETAHNQRILGSFLSWSAILHRTDFTAYFQKAGWVPQSSEISQQHNHKHPRIPELLPHLPPRSSPSPETPKNTKDQEAFFQQNSCFKH